MANENNQNVEMSKDELIGFHKGSISTLMKERDELVKMVTVVEQIMQAHLNALKDAGINLEGNGQVNAQAIKQKKNIPIEDLI